MFSDTCIANRSVTNTEYVYFSHLQTASHWQQVAVMTLLLSLLTSRQVVAEAPSALNTLLQNSCIDCHDKNTETGLDLTSIDRNFQNPRTFHTWIKIVDRISSGEMPPASEPRPDSQTQADALRFLNGKLIEVNHQEQQKNGRVPSRRLSRMEYEHTLHDLLGINGEIARYLPPETKSDSFDVVAARQEMSSVHVKGILKAADTALDEAIQLGPKPNMRRELDYRNSKYMQMWIERSVRRGGGTVFRDKDDLIMFRGENYNLRSDANGLRIPIAGKYRISVTGSAYQPRSSVTMSLKRQNDILGVKIIKARKVLC